MSSLKNIQLTFGDNAMSSKVLTSSQIEKIVKTIQRSDITTVYNGYVTCDTAISASNAFMLERNGITYTGSIIPDEYTISASKTTIVEGDEVIFESTGVAVESLSFNVKDIILNSEIITKEELLQAISINGNRLKFNSLNKKVDVTGNIIIEANTLYKPYNKKTITLTINSIHITAVTAEYEHYTYDTSINLLNFENTNSKTVTIRPTGVATIGIGSIIVSFENPTNNYNITNITNNSIILNCINFATKEPNKLIITVKDTLGYTCGTIQIDIDNRIPADVNIIGEESVTAYNGEGSFDYYISYTPNYYNVPITLKEVTSSNNNTNIIINDYNNGFKLKITGISENISTIITAKFTIDNIEKTITKSINIIYAKFITPFIIMNTTGSPQTFGYKMGKGESSFEIATMQGHVKGVKDYTDVQFSTIDLTTTQVNVTLQDGESFLIRSRTHQPSNNKYLIFMISSFAPDFDGDVLGTCGGDMKNYACYCMFEYCTGLTTAPELPATTLAYSCYSYMFNSCTGLTTAPELPATTLEYSCYSYMFNNCTSLTTAPVLPATTLVNRCYEAMFSYCTSLTTAPELPATILQENCYRSMFNNCTSLTTAPELPATILQESCYYNMFNYCTKLNYIKAMFLTTPSSSYTNNWTYNVSSTGIFVKNASASWDVTGANGIPENWTIETAIE